MKKLIIFLPLFNFKNIQKLFIFYFFYERCALYCIIYTLFFSEFYQYQATVIPIPYRLIVLAVGFLFFNHYQMGPIVLYYQSYSSHRLLLVEVVRVLKHVAVNRKVFFVFCVEGANNTFLCNVLLLLVKILEVQGGTCPPSPTPPSALDTDTYTIQ